MELARSCCRPMQPPMLRSIFQSFLGLWEYDIGQGTKCSKSNPVQSSRSKSTTCPRKESLLRFESNSIATSDGCAQKLGGNVHNLILKLWMVHNLTIHNFKFSVLTFSKVNELLDEHWAKFVRSGKYFNSNESPIYAKCDKINPRFVFKNSGISCLALIFNLNNLSTTVQYP